MKQVGDEQSAAREEATEAIKTRRFMIIFQQTMTIKSKREALHFLMSLEGLRQGNKTSFLHLSSGMGTRVSNVQHGLRFDFAWRHSSIESGHFVVLT